MGVYLGAATSAVTTDAFSNYAHFPVSTSRGARFRSSMGTGTPSKSVFPAQPKRRLGALAELSPTVHLIQMFDRTVGRRRSWRPEPNEQQNETLGWSRG